MRRPLVVLLTVLAVAPACRVLDARVHNLRELHEEDGRHKRVANLVGDIEYVFRYTLSALLRNVRTDVDEKKPQKVEDPLEECVDNLVALGRIDSARPRVFALQIEHFARLSAIDPWQISRQHCLRQLGKAGERLQLASHPEPVREGPTATPEDLRDALTPLIRSVSPAQAGVERPDFDQALAAMHALHYDLDGLLRALPASAFLLRHVSADSPRGRSLLDLVADLERRTVRLALEHGERDPDPHVRAAAIEGKVRAFGMAALAEEFPRLAVETEEEIQLTILALVRARGLPDHAPLPGADPATAPREGELSLLYNVAKNHPVERVRISAMATLGKVSGAGFQSLREEDWQAWWQTRTVPAAR